MELRQARSPIRQEPRKDGKGGGESPLDLNALNYKGGGKGKGGKGSGGGGRDAAATAARERAQSGGAMRRQDREKDPDKAWGEVATAERLETNQSLRHRYATDPESLSEEEKARAEVLLQRDERKRTKKAETRQAKDWRRQRTLKTRENRKMARVGTKLCPLAPSFGSRAS